MSANNASDCLLNEKTIELIVISDDDDEEEHNDGGLPPPPPPITTSLKQHHSPVKVATALPGANDPEVAAAEVPKDNIEPIFGDISVIAGPAVKRSASIRSCYSSTPKVDASHSMHKSHSRKKIGVIPPMEAPPAREQKQKPGKKNAFKKKMNNIVHKLITIGRNAPPPPPQPRIQPPPPPPRFQPPPPQEQQVPITIPTSGQRYVSFSVFSSRRLTNLIFATQKYSPMRQFHCCRCLAEFNTGHQLVQHAYSAHGFGIHLYPFMCTICKFTFNNVHQLANHCNWDHGIPLYSTGMGNASTVPF